MNARFRIYTRLTILLMVFLNCRVLPDAVTPSPTFTAVPTQTPALSTLAPVLLMVGGDVPCYAGPSHAHSVVSRIQIGDQAEVSGWDGAHEFWLVRAPDSGTPCWIDAAHTTVIGERHSVPTVDPKKIPTRPVPALRAPSGSAYSAACTSRPNYRPPSDTPYTIRINLRWNDTAGEKGYRVYKNGRLFAELDVNTVTAFDIFEQNRNTALDYVYTIEAFDEFSVSSQSTVIVNIRWVCKG